MPIPFILPMCIIIGFVVYGLIAKWYVMPKLKVMPLAEALKPILLIHSFRYIGMAFLIDGVTAAPLDLRFANPAAYGDLLAAVLALATLAAIQFKWKGTLLLAWIFNIEGTLDLFFAVFQGLRHTEDGQLGATFFIPAVIVPLLLVTHFITFRLLIKQRTDPVFEG